MSNESNDPGRNDMEELSPLEAAQRLVRLARPEVSQATRDGAARSVLVNPGYRQEIKDEARERALREYRVLCAALLVEDEIDAEELV